MLSAGHKCGTVVVKAASYAFSHARKVSYGKPVNNE